MTKHINKLVVILTLALITLSGRPLSAATAVEQARTRKELLSKSTEQANLFLDKVAADSDFAKALKDAGKRRDKKAINKLLSEAGFKDIKADVGGTPESIKITVHIGYPPLTIDITFEM